MAFSNIAGFEVTPLSPSSSIRRFSSPDVTSLRSILSFQIDCPSFVSSISGLVLIVSPLPESMQRTGLTAQRRKEGQGEKGRRGEGEKGRRGDGETGRRGEREKGFFIFYFLFTICYLPKRTTQ